MKKLPKSLEDTLRKDCSISYYGERIEIGYYTTQGQDCSIDIELGDDLFEFCHNLKEYIDSFDVDEEASLWIGPDGHGKSGAPYHISDIVDDMRERKEIAERLLDIAIDFAGEESDREKRGVKEEAVEVQFERKIKEEFRDIRQFYIDKGAVFCFDKAFRANAFISIFDYLCDGDIDEQIKAKLMQKSDRILAALVEEYTSTSNLDIAEWEDLKVLVSNFLGES